MTRRRVLIAKPGLDGHDRGAKLIARALRNAGMEVIYTGIQQQPAQIAAAALQEDVNVIGLSFLCGAHIPLTQEIMDELRKVGVGDKPVIVGGTIPKSDIEPLRAFGVRCVFPVGSSVEKIVEFVSQLTEGLSE